jgi:hypothetical protein
MSFIAMAAGGFYVVAGVVALRMMRFHGLMDDVLEALEGKAQPANERWKNAILTVGSFLTLASGAALAVLSSLALPLFLANTLVQGGYLLWAARAFPPADADEAKGRRQTQNAFVVYAAVSAFVVWLSIRDGLRAWPQNLEAMAIDVAVIAGVTLGGWASMFLPASWFSRKTFGDQIASGSLTTSSPDPVPVNLRLAPDWQRWPLWDADTGDNVSHHRLNLPDALSERIEAWDDTWQETYNGDDPPSSGFASDDERRAYREEGRLIGLELKRCWPGRVDVADEFR